jgi:transitional endoplasmic reticulum ATPase
MHTLDKRRIPSLYVKNAPVTYQIGAVFSLARTMAPCLLILEDIETSVHSPVLHAKDLANIVKL